MEFGNGRNRKYVQVNFKILKKSLIQSNSLIKIINYFLFYFKSNHKSAILCAVLTNSDEFLITGTYDRLINVIRVENGDVVHSIEKHFDSVTALAISQDDSILISGKTMALKKN